MSKKKNAEFMMDLDYLLSEIREYAEHMYKSKHTKNHGLTNSQFINFCALSMLAQQSCIFDRHNENVNKKLEKKKRTMK
jgi:hypothetical protein